MCERTAFPPVQVCTVGDLDPGQRYYDPRTKESLMIVDTPPNTDRRVSTINLANGCLGNEDAGVKLARNAYGCLYASRTLNAPPSDLEMADEVIHLSAPDLGGEG